MNNILVVITEQRFDTTPDGAVWTTSVYNKYFWDRYLDVFDNVRVVARVRKVDAAPSCWMRADGNRISFHTVPYYLGPWQYVLRARKIRSAVRSAIKPTDAVILRVGSQLGSLAIPFLRRMGHPYGVEVVGDPYEIFAPGSIKHPLRPFFRWWFPRRLRQQCSGACAAAYVTEHALQRRYPPAKGAFLTHYSSIDLPDTAFASHPRSVHRGDSPLVLVAVGSMEYLCKSQDIIIESLWSCIKRGLDVKLRIVGEGRYQPELETRARSLDLGDRVEFLGHLPAGEAVRAELDQADVFVLPSRTEGLPRAMIEAMARGLPCIGSTAGGTPELLPSEDLVPPGDVAALASKIWEVVTDPGRMARMSARNLEKAREYHAETLRKRRMEFYRYVKEYNYKRFMNIYTCSTIRCSTSSMLGSP